MNYAIQSETRHYPYLEVSARKRALKHSLIRVEQGLLLFRLGKHEYAVEKGQTLWIPFDCLCGLTFFRTHTSLGRFFTAFKRALTAQCRIYQKF